MYVGSILRNLEHQETCVFAVRLMHIKSLSGISRTDAFGLEQTYRR